MLNRLSQAIHVTTRDDVIRKFILLRVGDRCTDLRRAESERILRAQTFLADASVTAESSPEGGIVLYVRTVDEVAMIVGGAVDGSGVRAVRLGNSNLSGTSTFLAGSWREGGAYRDELGARYGHQQIFGRPYSIDVEVERKSLGDRWLVETAHPFYTDIQRIAWRVRSGALVDYIEFPTDSAVNRALGVERKFFDVGGVIRIGPPGRLTLLGASLSGDEDMPDIVPVLIGPDGLVDDTDPTLRSRYRDHRMARANVLWGVRDLTFKSRRGFDALTATQDIPAGFQLGTMFGRSLSVLGSRDDDIFMAADLYLGIVGRYSAFRMQLQGEGRRENDTGTWDGLLTSGRAAQYLKTNQRTVLVGSVEWSGGWHQRIPFNLGLDDKRTGVRGFSNSRLVGGQRIIARAESRWVVGPVTQYGDLGVAAFTDVGRLYAGDVPFGSDSPVSSSVGFSILAATPRGSARLWRMDVAMATSGNPAGRRWEVKFSGADNTKFFFREPDDVERTREKTVPSSVFRWP
ncbi:MAG TPA: hypothetical protein VFO55_15205 [Gemmatimonadaceae bacterium]|nr:hypothetical protein [Gemmatimonadaceae bacterium]